MAATALVIATLVSGALSFKASMDQAKAFDIQADLTRKQAAQASRTELLRMEQQELAENAQRIEQLDARIRARRAAAAADRSAAAAFAARGMLLSSGTFEAILRENHRALRDDIQMLNLASAMQEQEGATARLGYAEAAEGHLLAGRYGAAASEAQAGSARLQGMSTLVQSGMDAYAIS